MQILGTKEQKSRLAKEFHSETQQLQSLKTHKIKEEKHRDMWETQRVQTRQMDDWRRADDAAMKRKQQCMQIAAENRQLAEMKRQNEMSVRVSRDVTESKNVDNYFYAVQSKTIR